MEDRIVQTGDRVSVEVKLEGLPLTIWVLADVREVFEDRGLMSVVVDSQNKSIPYVAKISAIASNKTVWQENQLERSLAVMANAVVIAPKDAEYVEYGDEFIDVDDFADKLENEVPKDEWPESVFVAKNAPIRLPKHDLGNFTSYWSQYFDEDDIEWHGSEEFQAAIEAFNDQISAFESANADRTSVHPSTAQKILVADLLKGYLAA
jgi:hypothetical protein